jgi:DNA-directed RNA polymerase beta subunit
VSAPASRSATCTRRHYGRMCPIETPEGPNIGLIGSLATYARINEFGFVETPYRKVVDGRVTDQIDYLTADEEDRHVIAQANAPLNDDDGTFATSACCAAPARAARSRGPARRGRLHGRLAAPDVSVATAMIPFLEHDDANRALMGTNMQRQAVPLLRSEAPLVGTGMEYRAARDAGDVIVAENGGVSSEVAADRIILKTDDGTLEKHFLASSSARTRAPATTSVPIVDEGDDRGAGQVIADGPCTDDGEMALGRTCSWRSCPGRATTTRTRSSSPSGSSRTTSSPRSTSRSTRSTPATPSWAPRRSPGTSRTSPRRSWPTSTSAASSASAPRSSPATSWSARSPRRARPS